MCACHLTENEHKKRQKVQKEKDEIGENRENGKQIGRERIGPKITENWHPCYHLDWPRLPYREQFKEGAERQTEETMGRQHQRVDWPWMEYTATESRELGEVEEAGCKMCSGAPTVSQTTG